MADRATEVALFRYALIREAADPALSKATRGRLVRELAAGAHTGPGGIEVRVGRSTADQWIRAWRAGGFEALKPAPRAATPRVPAETLELAEALKREAPERTAAHIAKILTASLGWAPNERTIQRHFRRIGLTRRSLSTAKVAFGRFEATRANELWVGDALNQVFAAWVETVYHRAVHSETAMTPLERFAAGGPVRHPSAEELHEAFLWSETRTVTKTATVSLFANTYEVDAALVGRRVELVFDPFDLTRIEVRWSGRSMGPGVPVVIGRHAHPAARPEPGVETPPPATGIDYLHLVEARADAELKRRISYAGMGPDNGTVPSEHDQLGDDEEVAR